jgi:hypothetical protein
VNFKLGLKTAASQKKTFKVGFSNETESCLEISFRSEKESHKCVFQPFLSHFYDTCFEDFLKHRFKTLLLALVGFKKFFS